MAGTKDAVLDTTAGADECLDIFAEFATDEQLEIDGVWVDRGKASFLIAREGNPHATEVYLNLYDQNRLIIESGDPKIADPKAKEVNIKVGATAILKDWKNVSYKGQPLPYSVQNAEMLLNHRDFRLWVTQQSTNVNRFKIKLEEADTKNS